MKNLLLPTVYQGGIPRWEQVWCRIQRLVSREILFTIESQIREPNHKRRLFLKYQIEKAVYSWKTS